MRHSLLLVISCALSHSSAAPLQERRDLDPIGSFLSDLFVPATTTDTAATTTQQSIGVATTPTPDDPPPPQTSDDPKSKPQLATAATTSTASSGDGPSSTPTLTPSSTSATTTASVTVLSSSSASAVPTSAINGAESVPTTKDDGSGSSISTAGIVVAVLMSLAVIGAILFVLFKYHGPLVRWRKRREYVRMQERSYRPALDGPFPQNSTNEKGLGISNASKSNRASVMSFLALARPKHQIKRKPVPASPVRPASANATGASPLVPCTSMPPVPIALLGKQEKSLPSLPPAVHR